jgi:hypothetical protein
MVVASRAAASEALDWQVQEQPAGPVVTWLRGARDGVLGLLDDASDLQVGVGCEAALVTAQLLMAGSDLVGVVDDNPVSEHVLESVLSKTLAKGAYLVHVSASEALVGSHGLEAESYLEAELEAWNPLLQGAPRARRLPLDPLEFLREGMLHGRVYEGHVPGNVLARALLADLVLRPSGNLVRLIGLRGLGDRLERKGRDLVRGGIH